MPADPLRSIRIRFAFLFLALAASATPSPARAAEPAPEVLQLFELLDLSRPELEAVQREHAAGRHDAAMRELLTHYRERFPRAAIKPHIVNQVPQDAEEAVALRFRSRPSPKYFQLHRDFEWDRRPEEIAEHHWLNLLVSLHPLNFMGDMYLRTNDKKYAEGVVRLYDDWRTHCPPGSGAPSWSLAPTMIRSGVLLRAFERVVQWPDLPPDAAARLLVGIHEHVEFMHARRGRGNQDATNSEHLMRLASGFPEFRAAGSWLSTGFERISERIYEDVLEDGCQREMTSGYHLNALNTYTLAARRLLAADRPLDPKYRERLEKMYEWCLVMVQPDGGVPTNGDSVGSGLMNYLADGGELFDRPDMTYVATRGRQGVAPPFLDAALPIGGYYTLRTSWTDPQGIYLFLDISRQPVVSHQDFDALHLDLFAYGRDFFPDKGTYTYGGEHHKAAKATRNHTTITIDERNQADAPAECHAFFSSPEFSFLDGSQPGYPQATHRRQVAFVRPTKKTPPYVLVIDRVTGEGTHLVDQHFHFGPGSLIREESGVRTAYESGGNLRLVQLGAQKLETSLEETEMHPRQGQTVLRPAVRFRQNTKLPATFVTLLVPYDGATPPALEAKRITRLPEGDLPDEGAPLAVRVDHAGGHDVVVLAAEPIRLPNMNTPVRAALIRTQGGDTRQVAAP